MTSKEILSSDAWCLPGEEWKDIKGFEGIYQASTFGRIRSLDRCFYRKTDSAPYYKEGIIRNLWQNEKGYLFVTLYDSEHNVSSHAVHRLIAETFIENDDPEHKVCINHKIEWETYNNCVDNLEWCTPKYNANYGTGAQRGAASMIATKQSQVPDVYQYTSDGDFVGAYTCCADAARKTRLPLSSINKCCNHQSTNCHGYIFRYDYEGFSIDERGIVLRRTDKIDCYTKDGEFIKTYDSPIKAAIGVGKKMGCHISSCCNGLREWAYGYVWRWHGDPFNKYPKVGSWKKKLQKEIVCLTKDMELVAEYESIKQASSEPNKKSKSFIALCLCGKKEFAYGYKWMYKKDYLKYLENEGK